jgi:hypothetical protein
MITRAQRAEHRPKFCSPSPAVVTSPYTVYMKNFEREVKQYITLPNHQTNKKLKKIEKRKQNLE